MSLKSIDVPSETSGSDLEIAAFRSKLLGNTAIKRDAVNCLEITKRPPIYCRQTIPASMLECLSRAAFRCRPACCAITNDGDSQASTIHWRSGEITKLRQQAGLSME